MHVQVWQNVLFLLEYGDDVLKPPGGKPRAVLVPKGRFLMDISMVSAIFVKYGFDKEGLMPYIVFLNAISSTPARCVWVWVCVHVWVHGWGGVVAWVWVCVHVWACVCVHVLVCVHVWVWVWVWCGLVCTHPTTPQPCQPCHPQHWCLSSLAYSPLPSPPQAAGPQPRVSLNPTPHTRAPPLPPSGCWATTSCQPEPHTPHPCPSPPPRRLLGHDLVSA